MRQAVSSPSAWGRSPHLTESVAPKPPWLQFLNILDDACYGIGAPHFLDLSLWALGIVIIVIALAVGYRFIWREDSRDFI